MFIVRSVDEDSKVKVGGATAKHRPRSWIHGGSDSTSYGNFRVTLKTANNHPLFRRLIRVHSLLKLSLFFYLLEIHNWFLGYVLTVFRLKYPETKNKTQTSVVSITNSLKQCHALP